MEAEGAVGLWEGKDVTGVVKVVVALLDPTDREPDVSYSGERKGAEFMRKGADCEFNSQATKKTMYVL